MGKPTTRILTTLALLVASGLGAQEGAYKAQYQIQYKRFTRGDDAKVVDEAWGRLEWFRERMGGDLGPDFTRRLLGEAERERARRPERYAAAGTPEVPVAVSGGTWVNLGPTTSAFTQNGTTLTKIDSGRLRTILPDPADATGNTVYLLASGGGLWKTTNFLSTSPTWTPLTDFIGSNLSGSAAFGRLTSTLFVGAGDPFDLGVGGFMVKSTDGGSSWSAATQLRAASKIYDIKVDVSQAQDIVLVGTNDGLFRSTDAGATYAPLAALATPAPSAATYPRVWSLARTNAGWLAAAESSTGTGALFLSTDQGATWAPAGGTALAGAGRITLAQGLPGDAVVYAYAANAGNKAQLDLFRSTDGGQTWTGLGLAGKVPTNKNTDNPDMDLMAGQPWYNHMILVDPADATRNTVYLGGQLGSAKTVNGGTTWTLLTNWMAQFGLPYAHADFHCAAYSNLGGTPRLYFGTDGGLFTSTDGGTTWDDTKNKGLVNHLIYTLAANPGQPGSALVGMQDNGTRIRSGLTSTFNQVRGGDGFGVAWAQAVTGANAVSMSSYVYNSIRRATTSPVTDQANWSAFTTGLGSTGNSDNGTNYYFVTPLVTPPGPVDPSGQVFFTYNKKGTIYQSSATGWGAIGTAGSGGINASRVVRSVSHGIGVSPTDLQHIAAAGSGGYLLLTANGGNSWNEVFLGALDTNGNQAPGSLIAGWTGYHANIAWANNAQLYVCSESPLAGAVRVARSADGGVTWAAAATGLPDVPVTKLAVDPGDGTGNTVYAATWLGVYRTTNGGNSWSVFGTGLPQGRVTDLWVAPDSSSLRVATWGRGVWELSGSPAAGTVNITPTSTFLYTGQSATFTGTVNGGGAVTYAATGGTITAAGAYTAGTTPGNFTVTATNAANPSQSAIAAVAVAVPSPVTFPTQPLSQSAAVGHKATFTVVAAGSGSLTYQWKRNGVALAGATTATYTTPTLALADNGSVYTCEVTGYAGMVASNPATLTVQTLGPATTSSSSTVVAIPDASTSAAGTPVEIPFTVSGVTGSVGEVTLGLYATHTWVADLEVTLVAPDGSTATLARLINAGNAGNAGGAAFGTSCGTYATFADLGTASIQTQTSANLPLTGTYIPLQALDRFNGKSPNGTWKLRIQDLGNGDTGTFNCGVLTVKPFTVATGPSLDLNGDRAINPQDLLFFAKYYGTANATCDLNGDGTVNDADLTILLAGL